MTYRVKAAAAVIKIGGTEQYLYRGNIVPAAATNAEHLHRIGLLEEFTLLEVPEADSTEDELLAVVQGNADGDPGAEQPPAQTGQEQTDPPAPPAKVGPGSSAEAWRTYAKAVGVEVPSDADRAAVIAALEADGKPTE